MERRFSFDARWLVAALVALAAWEGARVMRRVWRLGMVLFWVWFGTHGVHWLRHLH